MHAINATLQLVKVYKIQSHFICWSHWNISINFSAYHNIFTTYNSFFLFLQMNLTFSTETQGNRKHKTETNGLVGIPRKETKQNWQILGEMDDEMNSLPQSEYEGAILVIKDKLRKGDVELPEIEQILEDKYQAMKHMLRAGTKTKMIMPSSQANPIRKSPRKHLKDIVGTVENLDIKQQIVPTKKANKIRLNRQK